ncbi:unnamed protein product [Arabis nemorensis]|uniref:Uncharacterized protein n=1 Tax=Arabis nemorensis TaxID=586526 RepID=A0A565BCT3_9BRAS|nr:unnamed protein product [Arabis nemorensis]
MPSTQSLTVAAKRRYENKSFQSSDLHPPVRVGGDAWSRRTSQRLLHEPDSTTTGTVPQMGRLGASLLHHQLPHDCYPRRRTQC